MSEVLVEVGLRYEQTYIPWKHRLTCHALLERPHFVSIRAVELDEAPVAFRIHATSNECDKDAGPACTV